MQKASAAETKRQNYVLEQAKKAQKASEKLAKEWSKRKIELVTETAIARTGRNVKALHFVTSSI